VGTGRVPFSHPIRGADAGPTRRVSRRSGGVIVWADGRKEPREVGEMGEAASELIHQFAGEVRASDGRLYTAQVFGAARADGTWEGWLEFRPGGGSGQVLRTDRETTQPDRDALAYWASGLEPLYFDGALARARAA
jgi:hypothetical protein